LDREANIRIGYSKTYSDEDEEMDERRKKKKKVDNKLKQTKLTFLSKRPAQDSISDDSNEEQQ
jgi:hypothetical protein